MLQTKDPNKLSVELRRLLDFLRSPEKQPTAPTQILYDTSSAWQNWIGSPLMRQFKQRLYSAVAPFTQNAQGK